MAVDPIFALYDILHFVAAGYRHYLNVLEHKENLRTLIALADSDNLSKMNHQNPKH